MFVCACACVCACVYVCVCVCEREREREREGERERERRGAGGGCLYSLDVVAYFKHAIKHYAMLSYCFKMDQNAQTRLKMSSS